MAARRWTDDERDKLREAFGAYDHHFEPESFDTWASDEVLPHRTGKAIENERLRMGLTVPPRWSEGEKEKLRSWWNDYITSPPDERGTVSAFEEGFAADHDKTIYSVQKMRDVLGLQMERGGAQPGAVPAEPKGHGVLDEARELDLLDYSYADGTYFFPVAGSVFPVPEETWEWVCAEYSEMGGDKTAKEVAREIGMPVSVLKRCLRQANQYKASLPMSRESLISGDPDELAEKTVALKEREVVTRAERKMRLKMHREWLDLRQWKLSEERFIETAKRLVGSREVPKPEPLVIEASADPFVVHAPTTDEHIGLLVRGDEIGPDGANYDTSIAVRRLKAHADRLAEWVAVQPGKCNALYRTFVGDLFHAITGETEHGTALHQDSRTAKVWDAGLEAVEYSIQRLRQVAGTVHVYYAPGNHDGRDEIHKFFRSVERTFKDVDSVAVHVKPTRFVAFRVNATLHVLDHGYGVGSLQGWKAKALAETVARRQGADLFDGAESIVTYMGHLHERAESSHGDHHRLIRLEALTNPDTYATDLRFAHQPGARAFRLDAQGRIETERTFFADELS